MFQNLRNGSPFYILYKSEPRLVIGEVVGVTPPVPKFGTTYQNGIIAPPRNVVDVKIRSGSESIDLQELPADLTIADFGNTGMVVSESKEAIINEIDSFRNSSVRALGEVDRHKKVVEECDKMYSLINPRMKADADRDRELESIKEEMSEIKSLLRALGRSKKEEVS